MTVMLAARCDTLQRQCQAFPDCLTLLCPTTNNTQSINEACLLCWQHATAVCRGSAKPFSLPHSALPYHTKLQSSMTVVVVVCLDTQQRQCQALPDCLALLCSTTNNAQCINEA